MFPGVPEDHRFEAAGGGEVSFSELFAPRHEGIEPRPVDSIWPIWNVLDMTPHGRDGDPAFPKIDH